MSDRRPTERETMIPIDNSEGYAGPDRTWMWRGYKLGVHRATDSHPRWWEFTGADGLGSSARGPLRALVGWLRWRREYARRPWWKQD